MASSAHDEPVADASGVKDDNESWSGQSSLSFSNSDDQSGDDSDDQSGDVLDSQQGASGGQRDHKVPCRFYNDKGCQKGNSCPNLHVCKFSWKGSCRNGHSCRLKHIVDSDSDDLGAGGRGRGRRRNPEERTRRIERRPRRRSPSSESDLEEDGLQGPYRWQLDCGHGWKDIANDHILEAQYSRPCTKGINLYNTAKGVISIDFKNIRVLNKTNLRVRRRGSQQTKWLWHYRGDNRWYQYGEKDSKGNQHTVNSSVLETEYQKNKNGSHQFSVGSDTYEIRFKDMCQKKLPTGHKRKITRRPLYESPQSHGALTPGLRAMRIARPPRDPRWQFRGKSSQWYDFKNRVGTDTECSITSADIEAAYQQNPQGTMTFIVSGQPYKIDFSNMTQTNMTTNMTRKIQRV
ncbi:protein mono-ADP-ribosyltransferase PARP12 isoform X2 [Clupea harengus]|uniref:Protein mono-ADP-ribosyltransferase PARP12 isoform X2 n=1 Tax=Clupea harengus TaxID=7950 RepID=A0A6P3WAQ9_CLUHA|nr:protein mono-ADP-ribosyltransferase PARP12 isoform X2 [Clupea harengus]